MTPWVVLSFAVGVVVGAGVGAGVTAYAALSFSSRSDGPKTNSTKEEA